MRGRAYIGIGGSRPCTFSNDDRHCAASLVRSPVAANQAERSTRLPFRSTDVIPTSPATDASRHVPRSEPPRPDASCPTEPVRLAGSARMHLSSLPPASSAH